MPLVELPDGHTAEFPDNMSRDDILSVIRKKYPAPVQQNSNSQENPGFLKRAGGDVLAGIANLGQGFGNLESRAIKSQVAKFNPELASKIHQNNIDFSSTFGVNKPNMIDKFAQNIAGYAPVAAVAGPALGAQAIGNIAYGASQNPNNIPLGSVEGAITTGIGKAIPYGIKGIEVAAERINPLKFTSKLVSKINSLGNSALEEAQSRYNSVLDLVGNNKALKPIIKPDLVDKYFGPKLKDMYEDLRKNPTIQKKHEFQSQVGSAIRAINPKDFINRYAKEGLEEVRDLYKNSLHEDLRRIDNALVKKYKEASSIYGNVFKHFESTPTLKRIREGTITDISPKKLLNALSKAFEKDKKFPKNHYLREAHKELEDKLNKADFFSKIGSAAAGSEIGNGVIPKAIGGAAGLVFNPIKSVASLIQNPISQNLIHNPFTRISHEALRQAITSNSLRNR